MDVTGGSETAIQEDLHLGQGLCHITREKEEEQ